MGGSEVAACARDREMRFSGGEDVPVSVKNALGRCIGCAVTALWRDVDRGAWVKRESGSQPISCLGDFTSETRNVERL
jgi:hypothetical protein